MIFFSCCRTISLYLILLIPLSAIGQPQQYFIEGAIHTGGDEIPTDEMIGGKADNRVKAGGLFSANLGVIQPLSGQFELISSVGVKIAISGFVFDYSGDDMVTWQMHTFDLLGAYRTNEWRYGVGVTYHHDPILQSGHGLTNQEWAFDNAIGYSFGVESLTEKNYIIGVRITLIEYQAEGVNPINGTNVGLIYRYTFSD